MAAALRNQEPDLATLVQREPFRFSCLQVLRLLRQAEEARGHPAGEFGGDAHPDEELVRIGGCPTRTFPATEVLQVLPLPEDPDGAPRPKYQIAVSFMGFYGPSGVLPQHDTQRIIDGVPRTGDRGVPAGSAEKDLLDLFTHRVLSLFCRAGTKYRIPFAYERTYRVPDTVPDLFTTAVWSLAGLGTRGLRGRQVPPDEVAIEFAGFFSHWPRNAQSLRQMLESWFGVAVGLEQFVGQWMQLPGDVRSAMPDRRNPLGANCALGQSFILGSRIWDVQGKFRLGLGPLTRAEFDRFLPGQSDLTSLAQLARLYAGIQFDFDVQLELLAAEVPACGLSGSARLGQNSWLLSRPSSGNRADTILRVDGAPNLAG